MAKEPKELLREAREKRFKRREAAATFLKMSASTYRSYENGTRPITIRAAKRFQAAFGIEAALLCPELLEGIGLGGSTEELDIIGELIVGLWRDDILEESRVERQRTTAARSGKARRRAYRVSDASVNKVFQPGWNAITERPESDDPRDFEEHAFVVIERTRAGLTERSIRRIEDKNGERCVLACYSTDRKFSGERLTYPPRSKDETIIVVEVVVGGSFDL